jgi:hypothetical protein
MRHMHSRYANALSWVCFAWALLAFLWFCGTFACYWRQHSALGTSVSMVHLTMGLLGESTHLALAIWMGRILRRPNGIEGIRLAYLVIGLIATFPSTEAIRHGLLAGDQEKPVFLESDSCKCVTAWFPES